MNAALPEQAKTAPGNKLKKVILTTIQVLVTAGILFWVFHDPVQRAQMWEALIHAKPVWLLAGFLCYGWLNCSLAAGGTCCCGCRESSCRRGGWARC
jgi:hypothetical protein